MNTIEKEKEDEENIDIEQIFSDTLDDIVREHVDRVKEAEILLGGCLDMVCTYSEGYKSRQPLYSCKTCAEKSGDKLAGICYGCSENCHDGHELIELYTKRSFCCDCGNSKFPSRCKLFEAKEPLNACNKYNDNFKGKFCLCKNYYPPQDLEDEPEDMIQCCICEDWYHLSHIFTDLMEKSKLDRDKEEHFDLICLLCMQKSPWLIHYKYLEQKEEQHKKNKTEQHPNQLNTEEGCKLKRFEIVNGKEQQTGSVNINEEGKSMSICLPVGWRDELCRCNECMLLYEQLNYLFLLDHEDTMEFYEQQGRERATQLKEEKCKQDTDQLLQPEIAIKLASGIEQMKKHCSEFFAKRTTEKRGNNEALTKDDVIECFQELEVKRQRLMQQMELEGQSEAAWTQ